MERIRNGGNPPAIVFAFLVLSFRLRFCPSLLCVFQGKLCSTVTQQDVSVDSWYEEFMEWATEPNQAPKMQMLGGGWNSGAGTINRDVG